MFKSTRLAIFMSIAYSANAQTQDTLNNKQSLQEVVVSGIRAKEKAPVTQLNLKRVQIEEKYYGADLPALINSTPSVNAYSDNGTGIGYSTYRLRGLDATRINFTINGIPVNDPETQGVFTNNFADLASSAENIQIQRGVGTSTNGTASFAGSINITTKSLTEKPEFTLHTGYGSFNTSRLTAEYQTGLLQDKFAFYGRLSDVSTDGYRDHSGSHIRSMFLSGAYFGKRSVFKINIMTGRAASQISYLGIDKATLDSDRKTNAFVNNERDAFTQDFYQLQYSYHINAYAGFSVSAYHVRGDAPQFQYYFAASPYTPFSYFNMPDAYVGNDTITQTDVLASYRLDQKYYGAFANYFYKKNRVDLNLGIHANTFSSDHFMEVNWARILPANIKQDHLAYFNTGYKTEMSAFAKLNYTLSDRWNVFGDLQVRNAMFSYQGKDLTIRKDPYHVADMSWVFFNPKLGFRYELNEKTSFYVMAGRTSREPTRFDYFQDDFATKDVKQSDIKPETANDLELGTNIYTDKLLLQGNVFWMQFENQILNTGQLNAFGYPVTTNVKNSSRKGLELSLTWKPFRYLWLMNSSSLSDNRIDEITQYYTKADYTDSGFVYKNTKPALSPELIINQGIRIIPVSWLYVEITGRYVSRQQLDNSNDKAVSIPSFYYADARVGINLKRWIRAGEPTLSIQVNNITDEKYAPSGSTAYGSNTLSYDANGNSVKGTSPLYFPAATRNVFVTLGWKF